MNISEELVSLSFYLSFSATMMNEIFLPCYFGNEVTLKREKLTFAIYSSNWIDLSEKFKKNMIIFLEGLKRVRILKSGKVFTLSLFSFLTVNFHNFTEYLSKRNRYRSLLQVCNRSYSLFAVLRNFIKWMGQCNGQLTKITIFQPPTPRYKKWNFFFLVIDVVDIVIQKKKKQFFCLYMFVLLCSIKKTSRRCYSMNEFWILCVNYTIFQMGRRNVFFYVHRSAEEEELKNGNCSR